MTVICIYWNRMHLSLLLLWIYVSVIKSEEITDCAAQVLDVSCNDGEILVFESVEYGRQDDQTCASDKASNTDAKCSFPNTVGLLNERCFGKTTCLLALEKLFRPDPCPDVSKYLKAVYSCVQKTDIHNICDRTTPSYIEKQSGYIISPNYPKPYDPKQKCRKEIKQPVEEVKTRLILLDLEVEARTTRGCYDWLTFYELSDETSRYDYCGTLQSIKEPTILSFRQPAVRFQPDPENNYRGFLIKFEVVGVPRYINNQQKDLSDKAALDDTDMQIAELKNSLAKLELRKKQQGLDKRGRKPRRYDAKGKEIQNSPNEMEKESLKRLEAEKREKEQMELENRERLEREKIEKEKEQRLKKLEMEKIEKEEQLRKKQEEQEIIRDFRARQKAKLQSNSAWKSHDQDQGQGQMQDQQMQQSFGTGCVKESVPLPPNSFILTYKEGKKVQIECSEGYKMDDEDNGLLVCHNDNWAGQTGKCIQRDCGEPEKPEHGEVIYNKPTIGSTVEYVCHKGYVLMGERTLTCQSDGQWSGYTPFCTRGGERSLSLFGEMVVAVILTILFLFFKKRLPRLVGGIVINFGKARDI